jgi:glycosyltransferase involved in cell wall biosynthesis
MKICMLSTAHSPYDDRIYYKETLSLSKKYSNICVIAPCRTEDRTNDPGKNGIRTLPLSASGSKLRRFCNVAAAIRTILEIKPDICHFHDYEFVFGLPFLRMLSKCKIIYDVHEAYPEMVEQSRKIPKSIRPLVAIFVDLTEKMLARMTDYVITADNNIAERFKHNKHVVTVFNYPRLSIFVPDQDRVSYLKKLYKGRTPIIYEGGISEDRGLFRMLDAISMLKDKRPDIILLLVGEMYGDLVNKARDIIKEKDLHDNVDIVGVVPHEDVVNYIHVSRVGLVPLLPTKKFMKNIPIKQFEYMACGIPVLGADLPPISSYIISSGCGRVFDPTRADKLAEGVIKILESESDWKRMSEAGRKSVNEIWNWDKMEEKLFIVYEDLTGTA